MTAAKHAWREPLFGAIHDWLQFWYLRVGLMILYAAAFALFRTLYLHGGMAVFMASFTPALLVAILIVGLYAFIQRQIQMFDDRLVVRQGRGVSSYRYADIAQIVLKEEKARPLIIIHLKSGKKRSVYLGTEVTLEAIGHFFAEQGVKCT